jgi:hypothetical protein
MGVGSGMLLNQNNNKARTFTVESSLKLCLLPLRAPIIPIFTRETLFFSNVTVAFSKISTYIGSRSQN